MQLAVAVQGRCSDGSCSEDCMDGGGLEASSPASADQGAATAASPSTPASTSAAGPAQQSAAPPSAAQQAVAAATMPPQRPVVRLRGELGGDVRVRRGVSYLRCRPGVAATELSPCEEGAEASPGEDNAPLAGGGSILLCPPDGCEATGCVGHRFVDKDVTACGIDTVGAEGMRMHAVRPVLWQPACRS